MSEIQHLSVDAVVGLPAPGSEALAKMLIKIEKKTIAHSYIGFASFIVTKHPF
jgi:hypothetical protein